MKSAVVIRSALPDDLSELIRLCAAHAAYEQATYDPAGKAERLGALLFTTSPRLFCVVAEHAGDLIGYATWSQEVSTWDAWLYAHMDCLYLDPQAGGVAWAVASWRESRARRWRRDAGWCSGRRRRLTRGRCGSTRGSGQHGKRKCGSSLTHTR